MRVRTILALLVALVAASCGGRSSPAAPTAAPSTPDLASGQYLLIVTMSTTGEPMPGGAIGTSVCLGYSGGFTAIAVPTTVRLDRTGDEVTLRAIGPNATFRMDLRIAGATVSGTASGQFPGTGSSVVRVDNGAPGTAAAVTGVLLPSSVFVASGKLTGTVDVGGIACSNSGHTWALTLR